MSLEKQLIGSGIQFAANKLLNRGEFEKVNLIDKFIPGGGYTGQGTGEKTTKGPTTFGGIAKQGIMSVIARALLGPILGPLALTVGQNFLDKRQQGLSFNPFGGDGDDGPIGPGGINLVELQKGIQSTLDDTDPADIGLVDAATANIQDYADIMPEDSGSDRGGSFDGASSMEEYSSDPTGYSGSFRYGGLASLYK